VSYEDTTQHNIIINIYLFCVTMCIHCEQFFKHESEGITIRLKCLNTIVANIKKIVFKYTEIRLKEINYNIIHLFLCSIVLDVCFKFIILH